VAKDAAPHPHLASGWVHDAHLGEESGNRGDRRTRKRSVRKEKKRKGAPKRIGRKKKKRRKIEMGT
jgi:hypothetical protein